MKKPKTTPTTNGNGHAAPAIPVFAHTRFDDNEFTMLRAVLKLYDDMITQTRYDVAGQVVDEYIVDPLDIAMRLSGMNISTGLLPRNCLLSQLKEGQKRIGILIEPRVWVVNVSGEKKPWRVPLPALVFVGQGIKYGCWALSSKAAGPGANWRLKPETAVFAAPCSNVSGNGVCAGSVKFPMAAPDTIWEAWGLFIESEFNTHLDTHKSRTRQRDSILKIWRELHEAEAEEYPVDDLYEVGTLKGVIEGE
jgi:hypothetical protein